MIVVGGWTFGDGPKAEFRHCSFHLINSVSTPRVIPRMQDLKKERRCSTFDDLLCIKSAENEPSSFTRDLGSGQIVYFFKGTADASLDMKMKYEVLSAVLGLATTSLAATPEGFTPSVNTPVLVSFNGVDASGGKALTKEGRQSRDGKVATRDSCIERS
jgi:hypothetical protein